MSRLSGAGSGSEDLSGAPDDVEVVDEDDVVVGENSYTSRRIESEIARRRLPLAPFPPQASKGFPGQGRSHTPVDSSVPVLASIDWAQ